TGIDVRSVPSAKPRAARARPLAVQLGKRLAPAAALFAVHLRVSGQAWLFGEELPVHVAEARRTAVGRHALAYRTADLQDATGTLPDVLPADAPDTAASLSTLASRGAPPAIARSSPRRAPLVARQDFNKVQAGAVSVATVRAGLLSAHGAATLFFPYFD